MKVAMQTMFRAPFLLSSTDGPTTKQLMVENDRAILFTSQQKHRARTSQKKRNNGHVKNAMNVQEAAALLVSSRGGESTTGLALVGEEYQDTLSLPY